ncbi:MAG: S1 RNA-binding domain-containing protein [Candidatus Omnitrophica bacterium]|nr:S1 RNA-binding domain-containing protein [Candidatus Omnitrophota bacterium]
MERNVYTPDRKSIYRYIAEDLELETGPVVSTVELIVAGGTVPFIARYRKEKTGGLDETRIRSIQKKLHYYAELEQRKQTVLNSIDSQDRLTDELKKKIVDCREKQLLEDLYLPYKPKKNTKASLAREKGLEPLAGILIKQQPVKGTPEEVLGSFVDADRGVKTPAEALQGAVDILTELISENAGFRSYLRSLFEQKGLIVTKARKEWQARKSKFEMYYNSREFIKDAPSHRLLAIRRGSNEKVISWKLEIDTEEALEYISSKVIKDAGFVFADSVRTACRSAYTKMAISVEFEVFNKYLQKAEEEAIRVFSKNLRNLLLEPPAGHKVIMGIDPGFRTGCKVVVIDSYGHFKEYLPVFPHPPQEYRKEAVDSILQLIAKYKVELVAIGNGTASRETAVFIKKLIDKQNLAEKVKMIVVSEAGASVYSASEVAIREFPELDVTVRGAISIARRLQDPISELVKIDPKSIGVGQYQHDVNQSYLRKSLESIVESCVNFVGVELNTASKELLSYVAGIGSFLAENIVERRKKRGPFKNREELLDVFMLGDMAFEQSAGFLRIRNSENPLDNSAIHPESYHIVEKMARDLSVPVAKLIGNKDLVSRISVKDYTSEQIGFPTLRDIIRELEKPGLDPRKKFENIEFRHDIMDIEDLKSDMRLFGKVTNVTNFGAFVDVGVHQDGLIHISKLSKKFVKDPHEVVSVGDKVRVKVLSVDTELGQIDLERI